MKTAEEPNPPRIRSKRPLGRKTSVNFDVAAENDEQSNELDDVWGFNSMKIFLDKVMNQNEHPSISVIEAINNNITLFQNIRLNLQKKYQKFEESFSRPVTPVTFVRHIPVTRSAISRSQSISFQPNIQPVSVIKPTKRMKKSKEAAEHHQKPLTSQSIWNSINRFFSSPPTRDAFRQFLSPIEEKITSVPLGQHYSILYNQKLKQKFKTDAVFIKTPEYVEYTTKKIGDLNVVSSHRLLAALIPIQRENVDNSNTNIGDPNDEGDQGKFQTTNDFTIDVFNESLYPTNVRGTSFYSKLSFEEKISLEVMAIGLNPVDEQYEEIDNEIMNDIANLRGEYAKIVEKTNQTRMGIIADLVKREDLLVAKQEKYKIWAAMIEKAEKENKLKSGKPKNRDKLT